MSSSPSTPVLLLPGDSRWPFVAEIVGPDIVVRDICITCFGGAFDPQDDGHTASGVNTKTQAIRGVSLAMDGRDFEGLSAAEHRALDGAPIPRLRMADGRTAWHTPVEITIGGISYTPPDGVVDLGPARPATTDPAEPHALDLTPLAAARFAPGISLARLSSEFFARGSFRILGGAALIAWKHPAPTDTDAPVSAAPTVPPAAPAPEPSVISETLLV